MTPLLNVTNEEHVESNEEWGRIMLAATVTSVQPPLGSVSDSPGYAHRPEHLGDANGRRRSGGRGRANTPMRLLKREQRMARGEDWSS
jgi:hypothetical protein